MALRASLPKIPLADRHRHFGGQPSSSRPESDCPRSGLTPPAPADQNGEEAARELLRRIATGEHASCAQLYQRYARPLFAKIFLILRNTGDTEDVLQETFMHVWKKAGRYNRARGSVFSWMMMIAHGKAIDRWRAQQRYLRATSAVEAEVCSAFGDELSDGNTAVKQSADRDRMLRALDRLCQHQRKTIILFFFYGLTQVEIAAQLGQPLGTVKARIRRGLLALRQALSAQPDASMPEVSAHAGRSSQAYSISCHRAAARLQRARNQ